MAVVGGIVAGATASYVGASLVVAVGVGIAAAVAYDYAMDALMEDATVDTMGGRNVNTKATTGAREIVYGKIRKGGNILWQDVAGENNKFLYQITAISHSECQSIDKVYFDGDEAWSGGVYNSNYFETNNLNIVKIEVKTGTTTQTEISTATTGTDTAVDYWVNDGVDKHRLSNIAYVWTRFTHNTEKFPNGAPAVTALIQGRKVYDPRVGSHSESNPATWAFRRNPVLCLFDYLRNEDFGAGIPASEFDEAQIESAATFCDASVGSPSRIRYVCDGVVNTGQSIRQNIKNLLTCMNGRITYAGGKLRIEPAEYVTPHDVTLNEDIIIGDFTVTTKTPRQDNYNSVKGTYVSEHINYIKTEYPQQSSSVYEADDGGLHTLNLDLPFTTNTIRAQRLAKIVLLKSRMQSRIKAKLNAKALDYKVGDNVYVTNEKFGIADAIYEIINCQIGFDFKDGIYVDIEAKENSQATYDHTASTDIDHTAGQNINLPDREIVPPVDVSSMNAFGTVANVGGTKFAKGVFVTWSAPSGGTVNRYFVYLTDHNATGTPHWSTRLTTSDSAIFIPITTDTDASSIRIHVVTESVSARLSSRVHKQFDDMDYPSPQEFNEHKFLYVDDAQTPPTLAQWDAAFSFAPNRGDRVTLIELTSYDVVADAETYYYDPPYTVVLESKYDETKNNQDVFFGSTATATAAKILRASDLISSSYENIAYSIISTSVTDSNDGSTAQTVDVALQPYTFPQITLNGKPVGVASSAVRVILSIPASWYNNATLDDDYLFQSVKVVVRASYGGNTTDTEVFLNGYVR